MKLVPIATLLETAPDTPVTVPVRPWVDENLHPRFSAMGATGGIGEVLAVPVGAIYAVKLPVPVLSGVHNTGWDATLVPATY